MNKYRYLVMVQTWDPYAGEGGEWIWQVHADLAFDDPNKAKIAVDQIEVGLNAAQKTYSIGRVHPHD